MQNEKLHTTTCPGSPPETELYRFGADGNLRLYSYDRLFFALYGYDGGTTRTYKYSFDLNPQWVNGRLEAVNFNMHNAMFYPNSYLNFNSNGYYTKHYYNGMERIASRLGDQNLSINVNDPELHDRKEWQDSLIRKQITEITGYEFLPVGEEQTLDDPKPVFELPQIGLNNLIPNTSSIYYYHPNHLGSTCYVTDENASVVQGFLYAPFGEITNEYNISFGSSVLPKYSFNAKELDEETGMYYYEARYMAPPVFISRDPLFEKYPTFSPYAYCANNPVKYVDPDGRDTVNVNLDKGTIELIKADGDHRIFYYKNGKLAGSDQILKDKCLFHRVSYDIPYTEDDKELKAHNEHLLCSNSDVGERIFRKIVEIGSPVEWDYYSMKDGHGDLSSSGIVNRMVHDKGDYTDKNVLFWNHYHPDEAEDGFYPSHSDQDHARDLKGARCTLFHNGRSMDFDPYVKPKPKSYFSINYFEPLWNRFAK